MEFKEYRWQATFYVNNMIKYQSTKAYMQVKYELPIPVFVGLRRRPGTFGLWDRGFESRWGYWCSSLLFVVCCVKSGLCDELITGSEDPYRVCDLETSQMRQRNYELRAIKIGNKGSSSATGVYCCHLTLLFVTPTETYTTKYWKHFYLDNLSSCKPAESLFVTCITMYLQTLLCTKTQQVKAIFRISCWIIFMRCGGTDSSIDIVKGTDNECREDILRTWK